MSFFARLLGRHGENGMLGCSNTSSNKRQQPCSPPSGSFAPEFNGGRPAASPPVPVKVQNGGALPQQQHRRSSVEADSDEDDCTIRVPGSMACSGDRNRSNSLARRRAAIDISPRAVQRLSDKVAMMDAGHLDVDGGGVTRCELEALYTDMQLIHRGRSSMVYRAREVRSGRRVILKSYDSHWLANSTRRQALERHVLTLRAAQAAAGRNCGIVSLERVVENNDATYLVMQACNGGTLIEAIANSGGKLPERQVALKVALPMLNALKHLHSTGIVHRDLKPEHLMIHNGALKVGDFGSSGCATLAAASLASTLQKQALDSAAKQQQHLTQQQQDPEQLDQQQLLDKLGQLKQDQQLHLHSDCKVEAAVAAVPLGSCAELPTHKDQPAVQRFGVPVDAVSGPLSPSLSARCSVQAVRDAMNFRIGSIEYMAPEMLNKPTAAEVFHLVIAQGIDEDDLPMYDAKVDVWSMGVVLYEALSGLQPFLADSAEDMLTVIGKKMAKRLDQQPDQHHQHHYRSHHQQHWSMKQQADLPAFISQLQLSPDAKDFLACCLTWESSKRASAEQLLSHPWLLRMQDEAQAVAARRASSRRISMQVSMQRARLSDDASSAEVSGKLPAPEALSSLVDPVMAGMLDQHAYSRQNSLELMAPGLERSQTAEQLELGVRNVLRTHTQRLESKPMHARVHTA